MKIEPLEAEILSVDGWNASGGRSRNIWIQVPSKNIPTEAMNKSLRKNKIPCIKTAFDDALIARGLDGFLTPITNLNSVPQTISATFKPSVSRFSPIVENLSMKIAVALDIPTSYNYIVSLKKDNPNFKTIKNHVAVGGTYQEKQAESLQPYGIVSIDFLKPSISREQIQNEDGSMSVITHTGEELISFSESVLKNYSTTYNEDSDKMLLIQDRIESLKNLYSYYTPDRTLSKAEEEVSEISKNVAKSYLLREFVADCDFTSANCGFVINHEKKTVAYAPNFDYGESFQTLIKTKLNPEYPSEEEISKIEKFDPKYRVVISERKKKNEETLVSAIAQRYTNNSANDQALSYSEKNLRFIIKNYPEQCKEFLRSLVEATTNGTFNKIIDDYTFRDMEDTPLISQSEATMFKEYLNARAGWMQNIIENGLALNSSKTK